MNETLISACMMFLVPATILFGARRRKLVLSQGAGLLAWRSHDGNMALPDMVVDKPVFD
jgi:hypothetical protein